jgi:hypothetical protein
MPFDNAKPGQIAVNAPGCDRCGKMFLDCQCDRPAPADLCGHKNKYICNLQEGHLGQHEYHTFTGLTASWPNHAPPSTPASRELPGKPALETIAAAAQPPAKEREKP